MNSIMIKASLPWDELPQDASRARRLNTAAVIIGVLCFLIIPKIKLPPIPREAADDNAERIAHIVQERKIELPPPPPVVKKEEPKKEVIDTNKTKVEKPKPVDVEPIAKSKPLEIKEKASSKASAEEISKARGVAQQQLASVADDLADLRDMDVVATSKKPSTGGGLQKDSGAAPAGTSRNMITSRAGSSSGGVAYSGPASSGFGGGVAGGSGSKGNHNLGVKGTTNMQGKQIAAIGGGTGSGSGEGGKTRGEGGVGKRTQEDIRKVFDQNGGRLNNAYQRALKDDPSMEGTVRLKLTIDPSGKVLSCEVSSSDLNNPELEAKIVSLVKGFNFGDDNVEVWKATYPVNFYPN